MHNAPAKSDILRGKAQNMVRSGAARDFFHAMSILGKAGARALHRKRRQATRRRQIAAANYWWNKD